jgi:hypothetical protein
MHRSVLFLVFAGLMLYGVLNRRPTVDPIIDPIVRPGGEIVTLAEQVMRQRPRDTAAAYRELAELLKRGDITSSSQLGQEMNVRVTTIDKETATPLVAAMRVVFDGDTDLTPNDEQGLKKWQQDSAVVLERAAQGFEKVAK